MNSTKSQMYGFTFDVKYFTDKFIIIFENIKNRRYKEKQIQYFG